MWKVELGVHVCQARGLETGGCGGALGGSIERLFVGFKQGLDLGDCCDVLQFSEARVVASMVDVDEVAKYYHEREEILE